MSPHSTLSPDARDSTGCSSPTGRVAFRTAFETLSPTFVTPLAPSSLGNCTSTAGAISDTVISTAAENVDTLLDNADEKNIPSATSTAVITSSISTARNALAAAESPGMVTKRSLRGRSMTSPVPVLVNLSLAGLPSSSLPFPVAVIGTSSTLRVRFVTTAWNASCSEPCEQRANTPLTVVRMPNSAENLNLAPAVSTPSGSLKFHVMVSPGLTAS